MYLGICNYLNNNHYSYNITVTENPCVPGSIPGDTTRIKIQPAENQRVYCFYASHLSEIWGQGKYWMHLLSVPG